MGLGLSNAEEDGEGERGRQRGRGEGGGGRLGLVRGVLLITRRWDMKPARSCALHALRELRTQVRERLTQVQKCRAKVRERLTKVQKCRARVRGRLTRVQKCRTRARERHRMAQKSLRMARAAHRMAQKSLRVARERRQRDRGLPRIGVGTDLATNLEESGAYAVGARARHDARINLPQSRQIDGTTSRVMPRAHFDVSFTLGIEVLSKQRTSMARWRGVLVDRIGRGWGGQVVPPAR